ncbi:hypothetical protein ACJEBK_27250 [Peribacillus frigoritolerans]|uniref:hypothetical protein n=1 Tax=Peribacillus frigoritolerans TaxID=450367 RepID=UPI0038728AB3
METENNKKGYIRVGHLVYIIIIAVIVLAFFLVFALGDTDSASTTIGTASTVSSLILSVIAIVMTLIDVAGQRQSMVDLKETADKLQKSNEYAGNLTEKLVSQIADLQDTREQMVKSVVEAVDGTMNEVKEGHKRQKDLLEKIKNMVENEKYDEVKKVIENAKTNDFEIPNIIDILPGFDSTNNMTLARKNKDAINFLRRNFSPNVRFPYNQFISLLQNELKTSHQVTLMVFRQLRKGNFITNFPSSTGEEDEVLLTDNLFK